MKQHITPNLLKLARLFKKKGELFIVGGYVRNIILGGCKTDIDLASRLTNEEIKEVLFGTKYEVKEISKRLGTILISLGEERWQHTTFRRESYAEGGQHIPVDVEFIDDIEEDAKRRDFTVNAIYYNILKNEFIDFYLGMKDIRKRVIRTVETPQEVLCSDGMRILRMVRLASELSFKISGETLWTAYEMRENLKDISGARKYAELNLILKAGEKKSKNKLSFMFGLQIFNLLKLWEYYNAPVLRVKYKHVRKASEENRFIALLIDIISSSKKFIKSDKTESVNQLLGKQGMNFPPSKIEGIKHIINGYFDALDRVENKNFFMEYFDDFKTIREFLSVKSKRIYGKYNFFYNYLINNKIAIRIKDLKINSRDIGKNFPKIKEKYHTPILSQLLNRVFDGTLKNEKRILLEEVDKIKI